MATQPQIVVPNKASRWASVLYWFIWFFGLYGVISTAALPPTSWKEWSACFALVLLPVLAVRSLRAGITLDQRGFTSRSELRTQSFIWDQIDGFSDRGAPIRNKVGVDLSDGRWVQLQYHPFAADMIRQLEAEREKLVLQLQRPGLA